MKTYIAKKDVKLEYELTKLMVYFTALESAGGVSMRLGVNRSAFASALIIMAVISLLIMICLTRLDFIVHSVLYNFGVRFSYRWAMPYWTSSAVIIGLSWFNIGASFTLVYYVSRRRKPSPSLITEQAIGAVSTEGSVAQPEKLVETQILDLYCEPLALRIKSFDVRHPEDVIDSQC